MDNLQNISTRYQKIKNNFINQIGNLYNRFHVTNENEKIRVLKKILGINPSILYDSDE